MALGVSSFMERVKGGRYADEAAALKGLAKTTMSDADKEKVRKAVGKFFKSSKDVLKGGTDKKHPPTPKLPKKKSPTVSKVTVHKKKAATKTKPNVATKTKAAKPASKANGKPKRSPVPAAPPKVQASDVSTEQLAEIHLANERIGTITQAIRAMKEAKEVSPKVNVELLSQASVDALTGIVRGVTGPELSPQNKEIFMKTFGTGNAPTTGDATSADPPENVVSLTGSGNGRSTTEEPTDAAG